MLSIYQIQTFNKFLPHGFLLGALDAIAKPFQEHEATVISAKYKYSAATNPDVQKK